MKNTKNQPAPVNIQAAAVATLSLILQLNRSYGFAYLVKLLRGESEFLKRPEHEQLEQFGSLQEESFGFVQDVVWYLLSTGYLAIDNHDYGTLTSTDKAATYLAAPQPIWVPKQTLRMQWYHLLLMGELRDLRREQATANGQAPYEVFNNFSLLQVVRAMPATQEALIAIPGLKNMATPLQLAMLERIARISEIMKLDAANYGMVGRAYSPGHQKIREMFEAGIPVDEIARRRNIHPDKMLYYLEALHVAGHIDLRPWIESELEEPLLKRGTAYFKQSKDRRLQPAQDTLGMEYAQLRMCRLYATAEEPLAEYRQAS